VTVQVLFFISLLLLKSESPPLFGERIKKLGSVGRVVPRAVLGEEEGDFFVYLYNDNDGENVWMVMLF